MKFLKYDVFVKPGFIQFILNDEDFSKLEMVTDKIVEYVLKQHTRGGNKKSRKLKKSKKLKKSRKQRKSKKLNKTRRHKH